MIIVVPGSGTVTRTGKRESRAVRGRDKVCHCGCFGCFYISWSVTPPTPAHVLVLNKNNVKNYFMLSACTCS
jgi:hypothetical protein